MNEFLKIAQNLAISKQVFFRWRPSINSDAHMASFIINGKEKSASISGLESMREEDGGIELFTKRCEEAINE